MVLSVVLLVQAKVDFIAAGLQPTDGRMKKKTGAGILSRRVFLLVCQNMLEV